MTGRYDDIIDQMRASTLNGWNYLIRDAAEDVVKALEKHSFKLKDPELWRAANRLKKRLQNLEDYESTGFTKEE